MTAGEWVCALLVAAGLTAVVRHLDRRASQRLREAYETGVLVGVARQRDVLRREWADLERLRAQVVVMQAVWRERTEQTA